MPNNEAAAMTPFSVAPKANSFAISGKATPVGEDHDAFEKLGGSGEPPNEPLHIGDGAMVDWRRIRPDRPLIDVVLDAPAGSLSWDRRPSFRGHGRSRIYSREISERLCGREAAEDAPRRIVLTIAARPPEHLRPRSTAWAIGRFART